MSQPARRENPDNRPKIEPVEDTPVEQTPSDPVVTELTPAPRRRGRAILRGALRFKLMILLPLAALIYGAIYWGQSTRYITTENAYVKSHVVAISADVDGRVIEVNVRENDRVNAAQVLFRLDPRPFEIEVQGVRARLDAVVSEISAMRAEYLSGRQETGQMQEMVRYMQNEFDRQERLTARGVSTAVKRDEAEHELEMARRELATKQQENQTVLAKLGGNANIPAEQHPNYLSVLAELDRAQLDFDRTQIVAPADGVVSNISLRLGEYVEEGEPVFSLIQSSETWIEANLKETQLTHLHVGQKATLVADAYPALTFNATVESISPATGAEFALLPPQNATGNWVKVVQRLPVRLAIEENPDLPPLRAGMTVTVSIDSERDRSVRTLVEEAIALVGLDGVVPAGWLAYLPNGH